MRLCRRWRTAACVLLMFATVDVNGGSPTPLPVPSPTLSPTVRALPSVTPSLPPTLLPTVMPTISPLPTLVPSLSPSAKPTSLPTYSPTLLPYPLPTQLPTVTPVPTNTPAPSGTPSLPPTAAPTYPRSPEPTLTPSLKPTATPSLPPTPIPSITNPTALPTIKPSPAPVPAPTRDPTHLPTFAPTLSPTDAPTIEAIPSPMPTLPKAVYRPDFFHRNLRGVNPLALGIAFLSILGLVFAFSKGREMYDEWEVRTRKRDFGDVELSNVESRSSAHEETKDASGWRARGSDGAPMLGGSSSSSSSSGAARTPPSHSVSKLYPSRTISRLWRDAGIGPRDELGHLQEGGSGWAVSKSEMAHWPDGRVFLEKAGLGEFWNAFEAQAITSVDDLCDVSLVGDVELVREIGMNKVQVTLFRRAVSDRANAGSTRPMVQQLAASAHSGGGGGGGVGDGSSSGVDSGTGRDLRSNLLGKPLAGAVTKALGAQERQRRAAAARARELQGMERQKALDVLESRQAARQEQAKLAAKAQAKSTRKSASSAGGDGQLEGLLGGNLGFEAGSDQEADAKETGKKDVYQGSNSAPGTRGVAV